MVSVLRLINASQATKCITKEFSIQSPLFAAAL